MWRPGLVSEEEAMAWRAEAWQGHEDIDAPMDDFDEDAEEAIP